MIGNRIKQIRLDNGAKQRAFAEILNVTPSHVSMVESGKTNPSSALVGLICFTFHINETWLRTGEGCMDAFNVSPDKDEAFKNDPALHRQFISAEIWQKQRAALKRLFAPSQLRLHELIDMLSAQESQEFLLILNAEIKAWQKLDAHGRGKLEARLEDLLAQWISEVRATNAEMPDIFSSPSLSSDCDDVDGEPLRKISLICVGKSAAGTPIEMVEWGFDYVNVPDDGTVRPDDYIVVASGDSMIEADIQDGNLCVIRPTPFVENGQIALVAVDGDSTIKRFYIDKDGYRLVPCNSSHETQHYPRKTEIRILGRFIKVASTED